MNTHIFFVWKLFVNYFPIKLLLFERLLKKLRVGESEY